MSDTAISCQGLSKQYRLGERESYKALRDVITDTAAAPWRLLRSTWSDGKQVGDGNGTAGLSNQGSEPSSYPTTTRNSKLESQNSFWALNDVSFDVRRGEVVGIIGKNGAGKSTLLKILSRITRPTRGHAEINGRVGSLLEVGTGFHPELTGRENIYLNAAILGMRKAEVARKFDEIVAFAEVEKFVDTPVKRYSSGMYVRLAFAVAAHLEPEILVIDEVLAVGDAAFQKKCLGKIGEVAQGGRTVLFVSHQMGAIRNLCSEVVWLNDGRVMNQGPAAKIVDEYLRTVLHRSGSAIDLSEAKRNPGDGERLTIKSVLFNDGGPIMHGEPLSVEIEFETNSEIHSVAFGVGFASFEGTRLMTLDSDLVEVQQDLPKNHLGTVKASIANLQLQPGRYALDVGARSGNNSGLEYLASCAQLEVLPGPETPPLIIRDTGGVRVPAEWTWTANSNRLSRKW